ncbi:MAG TPA: hypothetical protein VI298_16390 [Geobacteraceae bacterium]
MKIKNPTIEKLKKARFGSALLLAVSVISLFCKPPARVANALVVIILVLLSSLFSLYAIIGLAEGSVITPTGDFNKKEHKVQYSIWMSIYISVAAVTFIALIAIVIEFIQGRA